MTGLQQVPTSDGRTVEVLTGGDPDGFALLFHGGSPSAAAEYSLIDDTARSLGLRLVTYSRPGYGDSTPRTRGRPVRRRRRGVGRWSSTTSGSATSSRSAGRAAVRGRSPARRCCPTGAEPRCRWPASRRTAPSDLDWFAGMAEENHEEYHAAEQGREVYQAYLEENFLPILRRPPDELAEAMGGLVTPVDKAGWTDEFADWLSRTFNRAGAQGASASATTASPRSARGASTSPTSGCRSRSGRDARTRWCPTSTARGWPRTCPAPRRTSSRTRATCPSSRRLDEILTDLKRLAGRWPPAAAYDAAQAASAAVTASSPVAQRRRRRAQPAPVQAVPAMLPKTDEPR